MSPEPPAGSARRGGFGLSASRSPVMTRARSKALEGVEGLAAGAAAPRGLAGRRAELGELLRVGSAAKRAGDRVEAEEAPPAGRRGRRGDAELPKLAAAVLRDRLRRPGGREHAPDAHLAEAGAGERELDLDRDDGHGRATRIGRRDR